MEIASEMSRSESMGSLKGKYGLARRLRLHRLLQHMGRAEVHANPEQVGQPVLRRLTDRSPAGNTDAWRSEAQNTRAPRPMEELSGPWRNYRGIRPPMHPAP